jgi:bis(5'-adenosyl)-triphosphatase
VSHVHVHILPRHLKRDRFANNDDIYPTLEAHEKQLGKCITQLEREQVRDAEQVIRLDNAASSSEAGGGERGEANMRNIAALNELIQSSHDPARGRGSYQENEPLQMDDERRRPRSLEEMEREAEWLKTFMKVVEDEASATSSAY